MDFRLGELFHGPGGIGWGALTADHPRHQVRHAWGSDYDPDTCETYRANIGKSVCGDIRTLEFSTLSPIDALAFGFPCNDFSLVGERKGFDGPFGPLYTYGVAALKHFQPKWFMAENVGGIRSKEAEWQKILSDMREAGYCLTPHLYKFEDYCVPQARHRIVIVGIREDLNAEFKIPAPLGMGITAREALADIPEWASHQERTRQSKTVIERLEHIRPGENAFTADLPEHLKIKTKTTISQIYKRLDPDKPSYTLTGSGGGGTHGYHWDEPRALTNRERARLQTFPDTFNFYGSPASVRKQIGMAVPPRGARIIVEAILEAFDD